MAAFAAAAANAEKSRRIRDVRDLFGGSGTSDQAHNKQSSTTGGRSKSTVTPGVHSRDTNEKHLIQNNNNNSKSKGPKVIAGDSGNVIFGDRNALLKDIKSKNESIGRKKRAAPKPPVLVDIDGGFDEQNTSEEAASSGERGSLEKSREEPQRPPPPNVASNPMLNSQMGKSRQYGSSSRDQTRNINDKINGSNGYHHKPSSKQTTDSNVEPKRVQSPLAPENGQFNANGFVSSYNNNSSSKTGKNPTGGQNPLFHNDKKGIARELSELHHPVQDNSSSSGIGSSISDSSASDPDGFKTKLVITTRPHGLSPLIAPATEDSTVTDYASSADDLDDSDSDFSDEMTMDFDEEEEQVEKRRMKLYEEYQGEDFAKYLKDEDDDVPKKKNNRNKKRKLKKKGKNEKMNDSTEKTVAPTISPTSTYSASSGENGGKRNLKLKLGQMFALPGAEGKQKSGHISPGGIHAFSYADSKIGTMTSEKDFDDNVYSTRRKSSGSGSAMFHETSDAQDLERTSSQRWWRKDMLSAKTLDSNSDIILKVKRHDSHSDIDLTSSLSADSVNPAIHNGFGENHGGSGYKTDDEDKMNDFESYRKNNFLYNTKSRKPSGGSKPNTSLFRKISRSFKKSHYKEVSDNTVDNPLTMSLSKDKGDLYL